MLNWFDEIKAWERVPDFVTLVVKRDGTIWDYGLPRYDLHITYFDNVALLADGTPVVIKIPVPGGYVYHSVYNETNVRAWQEEQFEIAYQQIHEVRKERNRQIRAKRRGGV